MKNIKEYPLADKLGDVVGEMPTGQMFAVYQDGKLYKVDYTTIFLYLTREVQNYIYGAELARRQTTWQHRQANTN